MFVGSAIQIFYQSTCPTRVSYLGDTTPMSCQWGGRATSADKILQHAQTMIVALATDREVSHESLKGRVDSLSVH